MAAVLRAELRAMGCAAEIEVVGGNADLLDLAARRLAELEACWSRFLPDSDVSRLNAAGGRPVEVDPATIDLLEAMVHAHHATDGAFDPTLLAPLVGLGYTASLHDAAASVPVPAGVRPRGDVRGVAVDRRASVAQLPAGTAIDAGGIGKGLAADLVAELLVARGADGAMVSVGGDLRAHGRGPSHGGWIIGVADAWDDRVEVARVGIEDGGIATSGTQRGRFPSATSARHHLLDPATGAPSHADELVQVTVVAGTAAWAEAFTKAVMVRGLGELARLDERSLGARAVTADGAVHTNDSWWLTAASTATEVLR